MRAAFVAAARTLIGTRYVLHGRLPGVGVDCVGIPFVSAWLCGARPRSHDFHDYTAADVIGLRVIDKCDRVFDRLERDELAPGCIVVMQWGDVPQHMGIVADWRGGRGLSMIHAENRRAKAVVEHRIWFGGSMQFAAAYKMPGVD